MKRFILFVSLLVIFSQMSFSATLMEEKLALEKSIQERCERLVEKIIGSRDMVVMANVEMEEVKPKEMRRAAYPGAGLSEEEYLPGITYSYMPMDVYSLTSKDVNVKRISILITLDTGISDALSNRVQKEVAQLIGLNPVRGDTVQVQKIAFARENKNWKSYLLGFSSQIYWLITLLLLTLFLFGPLRHFFKTIVKAMELRIEADTRIRAAEGAGLGLGTGHNPAAPGMPLMPGGPIELTLERRRPQLEKGDQSQMKRFGFINDENIKNLIYLIKQEDPTNIAVITSYLPAHLASQVLASLSPTIQAKVAINLSSAKLMEPALVDKIEQNIKAKIDYLLGGEDYFLNLLDQVDRDTQLNILTTLENENPDLAAKIRRSLFFFEDLILLDKNTLLRVIREVQKQGLSLALALKNASEDLKTMVMDSLTEGARAMLAEQIDLLGDVPEKRIQEEQQLIAKLVRNLEKNGEITIDRSQQSAPSLPESNQNPTVENQ